MQLEQEDKTRYQAICNLNACLDNYLYERRKTKKEKYLFGSIFGRGYTLKEKELAVMMLKQLVVGTDLEYKAPIENQEKLIAVLRNGNLGKTIRRFLQTSEFLSGTQLSFYARNIYDQKLFANIDQGHTIRALMGNLLRGDVHASQFFILNKKY